jgi:phosphoglycolate phosphatase-like HAD superfamily hydrolase
MRTVLTRQFRQEKDPEIQPDAVIDHLSELPAVLEKWRDSSISPAGE